MHGGLRHKLTKRSAKQVWDAASRASASTATGSRTAQPLCTDSEVVIVEPRATPLHARTERLASLMQQVPATALLEVDDWVTSLLAGFDTVEAYDAFVAQSFAAARAPDEYAQAMHRKLKQAGVLLRAWATLRSSGSLDVRELADPACTPLAAATTIVMDAAHAHKWRVYAGGLCTVAPDGVLVECGSTTSHIILGALAAKSQHLCAFYEGNTPMLAALEARLLAAVPVLHVDASLLVFTAADYEDLPQYVRLTDIGAVMEAYNSDHLLPRARLRVCYSEPSDSMFAFILPWVHSPICAAVFGAILLPPACRSRDAWPVLMLATGAAVEPVLWLLHALCGRALATNASSLAAGECPLVVHITPPVEDAQLVLIRQLLASRISVVITSPHVPPVLQTDAALRLQVFHVSSRSAVAFDEAGMRRVLPHFMSTCLAHYNALPAGMLSTSPHALDPTHMYRLNPPSSFAEGGLIAEMIQTRTHLAPRPRAYADFARVTAAFDAYQTTRGYTGLSRLVLCPSHVTAGMWAYQKTQLPSAAPVPVVYAPSTQTFANLEVGVI